MPLLAVGIAIALILLLVYASRASRNGTYIEIHSGAARVRYGQVDTRALSTAADILRDAGVRTGYITISNDHRVAFSWHVPPALHQQLRNVLLRDRALVKWR